MDEGLKHKQHSERLDKHRKEAFITCKEDCWCWDIDSLLQQLSKLKDEHRKKFGELKNEIRRLSLITISNPTDEVIKLIDKAFKEEE